MLLSLSTDCAFGILVGLNCSFFVSFTGLFGSDGEGDLFASAGVGKTYVLGFLVDEGRIRFILSDASNLSAKIGADWLLTLGRLLKGTKSV